MKPGDNCFIINNNKPVLKYVNKNSKYITSIWYWKLIPHDDVIKIYKDFNSVLGCDQYFWINLVRFCIFGNILYNGKGYFLQIKGIPIGSSFSSAFANVFLYFYEKSCKPNITAFRYIDDLIVFNCDIFFRNCQKYLP